MLMGLGIALNLEMFMGLPQNANHFCKYLITKTFINEMYLINGFNRASPGFRFESANRVGPGSKVTILKVVSEHPGSDLDPSIGLSR